MARRSRGGGPLRPVGGPSTQEEEPDLLVEVRELLAEDHPLSLLTFVSGILDALEDPGPVPWAEPEPPELGLSELVETFLAVDRVETTALLTVVAELAPDQLLARRVRRELARRDHRLPPWLVALSPVVPVEAHLASHPLGAFTMVLAGCRTAAGDDLTVLVEVDHTLGTVASEGFCYPGPADVAAGHLDDPDDPGVTVGSLELADARARVEEAVAAGRITVPPFETDTWPACRPLVEWLVGQLPAGGHGHVRPEVDEAERTAIGRAFLASPHGRAHDHEDGRGLLESLLWYGGDYGTGDPLTWSAAEVELLLADWLPRKVIADVDHLAGAPDVLRDLIRFGHAERGVADALTREALEAVDEFEPGYQETIRSDRPQGPAALLAAMGMLDEDEPGPFDLPTTGDPLADHFRVVLEELAEDVGGVEVLDDLDTASLPDEPVDWDRVPAEAREPVAVVAELTDGWCERVLGDVEVRTACRRLLADVAAADPGVFTGRGRADTAAAAVAWVVGKVNGLFDSYGPGWSIGEMTEWFGVSASPSQRARRMLQAVGADGDAYTGISLGTTRLLTGQRRRAMVEVRDVARTYLRGGGSLAAAIEQVRGGGEVAPDEPWPWDEPGWDTDPLDEVLGGDGLLERGVDPAPALPWRLPDPVDVLAVGWLPPEEFPAAVDRWPALVGRVGTADYGQYARVVQGTLIDLSREFGEHPVLVPLAVEDVVEHAEAMGLAEDSWQARATLAGELDRQGLGVAWPPGRNEPCWCDSGRKYKRCCGTVEPDPDRRPPPTDPAAEQVHAYEFEVALVGVDPPIWRRLQIASGFTFADLHLALQAVCGWDNAHLFAFRTPDGADIAGVPFDDGPFGGPPTPDAGTVHLDSYFARNDRCVYEYDFGDGWVHDLRVLDRITDPVDHRLRLLDGARAFPPEDCGGLPGYHACLDVLAGGDDPHDRAEWLGDWDPEAFDLAEVARRVDQ